MYIVFIYLSGNNHLCCAIVFCEKIEKNRDDDGDEEGNK